MKANRHLMVLKRSCPVCGRGHVLDESQKPGAFHAILYKPEDAQYADWFVKCPDCRNQIGVSPDLESRQRKK